MYQTIKTEINEYNALVIQLDQPKVKNAFGPTMIEELTQVFLEAKTNLEIRCICLVGNGDTFCSGANLNWMKDSLDYSEQENKEDAKKLYELFEIIDQIPLPVLACVHRYVLGGGVGLISACDYVIAVEETQFSFSEIKMGLIPACIGPFVLKKIGESWTRAMFLTAERFDEKKALQMGLIHDVKEDLKNGLQQLKEKTLQISSASPQAIDAAKNFILELKAQSNHEQKQNAINTLADIRVTENAQIGVRAFLDKKTPEWIKIDRD